LSVDDGDRADLMEGMNFGNFLFLALILSFSINCWAKSKLGEYYYGFGYSLVETDKGKKQEGDFLRLSAYGPNDSESDLSVHLDYGSVESNASDVTSLGIGINYLVHFEDLTGSNSPIHPCIGIGISYLDEEAPILLAEDGFTWSLFVGSEFKINRSFSAYLGGKLYGLWSDFTVNDLMLSTGMTWWIDNEHGVTFDYANYLDSELNQFTLQYLYSWK
jgi:hypothetical protein